MEDTVTNNKSKPMIRPQTSKYDKDIQQNFKNNNMSHKMIETRKDINIFQNFDRNKEIINEEMEPIEPLYQQKENLKNINLIEKDINSLYKWEHLFNNFRPLSCYTTIQNEPKKKESDKEGNKNLDFKSPILLVDLPESQMNLFFGQNNIYESSSRNKKSKKKIKKKEKVRTSSHSNNIIQANKNNKNNISHNIRPMSMYSPRIENSCYYYSSVFSDYYNEDFKSFCNKMPILKAKLKINSGKLKKEIESHDKESNKKEQLLQKISSKERIYLDKQDLIIAAKRRNPIPLLKSIFKQNYPGLEVAKENPKLYFNTMKPYGNDYGDVDYLQNDRWRLSNEIIKMRMLNSKNKKEDFKIENFNQYGSKKQHKNRLLLSYYDVSDPAIIFFNKKIDSIKNNNEQIFLNNENIRTENDAITEKEFEEDKEKDIINDSNINSSIKMRNENSKENNSIKNGKESKKIIIDAKKREKYKEEIISDKSKNIKPKLSLEKEIKRPKPMNKNLNINISQTLNNLGIKDENLYSDYTSSNCFPLKTSSDVGNTSYNKINKFIREKKLINNLDLLLSSHSKTSSRKSMPNKLNRHPVKEMYDKNIDLQLIIASKKIKPKKSFSLYKAATTDEKSLNRKKSYKKWDKEGNLISNKKSKVNYYCFNNYIETVFNKDLINFKKNEDNQYFFPMNAYNKLAGKYYQCDLEEYNNTSKQVNNFDYSRDEAENDHELTSRKKQNKENEDIYNQLKNNSSIIKDD